jgi:hypothetical protein
MHVQQNIKFVSSILNVKCDESCFSIKQFHNQTAVRVIRHLNGYQLHYLVTKAVLSYQFIIAVCQCRSLVKN